MTYYPYPKKQAKRKYQLMLLSSSSASIIDDDPGYSILYTINREREKRQREENIEFIPSNFSD